MKKIFALLMVATLLLGLLSGCGKEETPNEVPVETLDTSNVVGKLLINVNAAVILSYDAEGLVVTVAGADDNGISLAAGNTDLFGQTCAEAAGKLLADSRLAGFLDNETPYVLIKPEANSTLPSDTFLATVEKRMTDDLTAASYQAAVILLTADDLTDNGFINLAAAEKLMAAFTNMEFDTVDGTSEPIDGVYGFRVSSNNTELDLLVDATTGAVTHGTLDDVVIGDPLVDIETDMELPEETTGGEGETEEAEAAEESE